jgi:hypothetical protein
MLTPDEVSRLYNIQDVLHTDRKKLLCPLPDHHHSNYTPSFSIFWADGKQHWRCHGCGRFGDVIDLIGYLNIPFYDRDNSGHLKTAINILTGGEFNSVPVFAPPPRAKTIYQGEWKKFYPAQKEVLEYACSRGISDRVLTAHKIGQASLYRQIYMAIPTFHDGILQGIKLRNTSSSGRRYGAVEGSISGLFNYDGVISKTGTIFVVKGEIASMVMETFGYTACAPTGGEVSDISKIVSAVATASKIVLISDNDPKEVAEKQIRPKAIQRAKLLGAELIYPPEEFKDIDEWLLAKPEEATTYLNTF